MSVCARPTLDVACRCDSLSMELVDGIEAGTDDRISTSLDVADRRILLDDRAFNKQTELYIFSSYRFYCLRFLPEYLQGGIPAGTTYVEQYRLIAIYIGVNRSYSYII